MNYRIDIANEIILVGDTVKLVQTSSEYIVKSFHETPNMKNGLFLVTKPTNIQYSTSGFVISSSSAIRISPTTSEHIEVMNKHLTYSDKLNITPMLSTAKTYAETQLKVEKVADNLIDALTLAHNAENEFESENNNSLLEQQSNNISNIQEETKKEMLNELISMVDDKESLIEPSNEKIFAGRISSWDDSYIFESFSRDEIKVIKSVCLFVLKNISLFRIDEEHHDDILISFYEHYYNEDYSKIIEAIQQLDSSKEVIIEEVSLV